MDKRPILLPHPGVAALALYALEKRIDERRDRNARRAKLAATSYPDPDMTPQGAD